MSNPFFEHIDNNTGKQQRSNGPDHGAIVCEPLPFVPINKLPPRRWAYGHYLIFGECAMLAGLDGSGKGALAVAIALSFVTGQELLGEHVWHRGPVAILTYEDDTNEWCRRIGAACLRYEIPYTPELVSQFHFIRCSDGRPPRLAETGPNGEIVFPNSTEIIAQLNRSGAALWIVDPWNHAHTLNGNDNNVMAEVASEANRIAQATRVAGLIPHHLRKGATGSADDMMGATSQRATFRANRVITRMTEKEAETLDITSHERWRYIRVSASKENYAPPLRRATWFKLESVELDNPDPEYPDGDNVQAATPWSPPSPFANLALGSVEEIFRQIRTGPGDGELYSPNNRSNNWVGQVIVDLAGKNDGDANSIISGWVDENVLIKSQYRSPSRNRKMMACVTLNEAKAAEILGPLYHSPDDPETA